MEIALPPISINPKYEAPVRKLTKDEFDSLLGDIKLRGLQDPIVISIKGEILDGHNRFRACKSLGIEIPPDMFFSCIETSD